MNGCEYGQSFWVVQLRDVSQKMYYGLRSGELEKIFKLASLSYLDDSVCMANIDSPGDNVSYGDI
jgi:hypothetical protein